MALWHHSEALTACGEPDLALQCADEALAAARRVGHRGWTATALLARGVALAETGYVAGAEAGLRAALESSEHLSLFGCWARARLALLLIRSGRLEEASTHVASALASGPPLAQYEARLARCEPPSLGEMRTPSDWSATPASLRRREATG